MKGKKKLTKQRKPLQRLLDSLIFLKKFLLVGDPVYIDLCKLLPVLKKCRGRPIRARKVVTSVKRIASLANLAGIGIFLFCFTIQIQIKSFEIFVFVFLKTKMLHTLISAKIALFLFLNFN